MPFEITFQFVKLFIDGQDRDGRLIFAKDQLSAIIVKLDATDRAPAYKERWHIEVGFGECNVAHPPLFRSPEEAGTWVQLVLAGRIRNVTTSALETLG